jgi:UDP-N-acetylenolpyruvoylglucosamine reductase
VGEPRELEPVARHLPLRACPGTFERWVEVDDEAALLSTIRAARAEKLAVRVVPPFSDALPPEGGVQGLAMRLGRGFEGIAPAGALWQVGAAVPLAQLAVRAGWSALRHAGGTLGDALLDGWIIPAVVRVRRFRGRGFEEVDGCPVEPKALPVSATLDPTVAVKPVRAGTAFVEPGKRGDLRHWLRRARLGEVRLYDAALAEDDVAVLVNRGEATPKQLRLLLQAASERVRVATGLELQDRLVAPGRGGRW